MYMVPPFLAYYGVMSQNRTLLQEAYNQIMLYHNYLSDPNAQNRWKHVLLGSANNDEGYWTTGEHQHSAPPAYSFKSPREVLKGCDLLTGNGWAAAGMLRVLATIRNSQYSNTFKSQQQDLANWIQEVHTGMFALLVRLFFFFFSLFVSCTHSFL